MADPAGHDNATAIDADFQFEDIPVPAARNAGTDRRAVPIATGSARRGNILNHTYNERSESPDRHPVPEDLANLQHGDGKGFPERERLTKAVLEQLDGLLAPSFPKLSQVPVDWARYDPAFIRTTLDAVVAYLLQRGRREQIYTWGYLSTALRQSAQRQG